MRNLADDGDVDQTFNEAAHHGCWDEAGYPPHTHDPKRKKEEAEIKNEARDLINKVTRRIKEELSGKVKREQLRSITNFAKELDDAINSRDVSNIKTKIDRLKNAVTKSL